MSDATSQEGCQTEVKMPGSQLDRLPEELITWIGNSVSLDDLLAFALTSKQCHRCTSKRLKLQVEYHKQYNVTHDRQPLTIPELLRLTIGNGNKDLLWHIRTLEFWDGRVKWSSWTTTSFPHSRHYKGERGDETQLDPFQDYTHYDETYFDEAELDQYERIFRDEVGMTDWVWRSVWIGTLKEGDDEVLRGLLISQLPNIRTLTMFANSEYHPMKHDHPLTFIVEMINQLVNAVTSPETIRWPPGFWSLRKISVCEYLDMPGRQYKGYDVPCSDAAVLFRLPSIKILHLSGITREFDDPNWTLPEGCSSVEELKLMRYDIRYRDIKKLAFSARNLKKLILRDSRPEWFSDEVVKRYPGCTIEDDTILEQA